MTQQEKARRIIKMNEHFISKYQGLRNMALARADKEFAKECEANIERYQQGIKRWQKVL